MFNNVLEISEKVNGNGRVPAKIIFHKIHEDSEETNSNGLHWKEEYVRNNMASAVGMPICAEFSSDDKTTPIGHGMTGGELNPDGSIEPLFKNSEVVGVCENAYIDTVKDKNGNDIKALIGDCSFFNRRYPDFVKWIRANYVLDKVETSIEIMGLKDNANTIIYEEGEDITDDFRTPMIYGYSADCILGITPSDENAIIVEISQKKKNKEENKKMEFNMDEIKKTIQDVITEMNNKSETYETKISELNEAITAKDFEIKEKDEKIVELNASVEKIQAALNKLKEDQQTYWAEREILENELAKAKVAEKIGELNSSLSEFNDEEKSVAKEDIEKLTSEINAATKKEDLKNVTSEINSIKSKICMNIVAQQKKAEEETRIAEQNSMKEPKVEDIFSEMCSNTHTEEKEDINIF